MRRRVSNQRYAADEPERLRECRPSLSVGLSTAGGWPGKSFLPDGERHGAEVEFWFSHGRAKRWTANSISAVCGNISNGVTDSIVNRSAKCWRSRASVE